MHIAASSKRHPAAIEFRAALTWGLVVFVLTLMILVLGAIVLPAQASIQNNHNRTFRRP